MSKLDPSLYLSITTPESEKEDTELATGFNNQTDFQEIIVKYHGDIINVAKKYDAFTEILTDQYAIVNIKESLIRAFSIENEVEYIEMPKTVGLMTTMESALSSSCISPVQENNNLQLGGEGTIVGVIDSGIYYQHPDFRNSDGSTRILYIWDLSTQGKPPEGFSIGTEYTEDEINEALLSPRPEEIVPHFDFVGHGTAVTGIAAGNGRASKGANKGVAPAAAIIVVKLSGKGSMTLSNSAEIMRAVKYLVTKAQELQRPIAINLSFGTNNGSHDGHSLFEAFMDDMSLRWHTAIIIPTGNEGIAGHHYSGTLKKDPMLVNFIISAGLSSLYLTMWKPYSDVVDIEIISPSGGTTGVIPYLAETRTYMLEGMQVLVFFGEPTPYSTDQEIYIEFKPSSGLTKEGQWALKLYPKSIIEGHFDIWLPVTEAVGTRTSFTNPDANVSLTIPSTAQRVISVGGYDSSLNTFAFFSGRGFDRNDAYVKPDIVAPAVDIVTCAVGGGYSAVTGTSMAAPFVTGSAALFYEWGFVQGNDPLIYGEKMKSLFRYGAKRNPANTYPNTIWGFGELCLASSFKFLVDNAKKSQLYRKANEDEESPATSEDYSDFIIRSDSNLPEVIESLPYTVVQPITRSSIELLFVKREGVPSFLEKNFLYERPTLLGLMDRSSIEAAGILPVQEFAYLGLLGTGTLIAVIDTGIDYTHPDFIYENNTSKIVAIWDQTAEDHDNVHAYGRIYLKDEINAALASDDPYSIVPQRDEIGHGTFLAGIAAGRSGGRYRGVAPDARLIVVKLKQAKKNLREHYNMLKDVPVYQSSDVITGVEFAQGIAAEMAWPVSIICGLGGNLSPHDGSTLFCNYLSDIAKRRGICISIPVGNEAVEKLHYRGSFSATGDTSEIEFNVGRNEKGFTMILWNTVADKQTYMITSPTGEQTEKFAVRISEVRNIKLALEKTTIIITSQSAYSQNGSQVVSFRFSSPTEGLWRITVYALTVVRGNYDVWLPIRQFLADDTYFIMPDASTTITTPSDADSVLAVGAYNHKNNSIYISSGRGPTRTDEIAPALVAPGVDVEGPIPGGGYGVATGTSVAAAHVAGAAALMLEWGIVKNNDFSMNTLKIKSYLVRGARRRPDLVYPNDQWGFGELDLLRAFQELQ